MTPFADAREAMVRRQVAARGIDDPALLAALRAVPREQFVAPALAHSAHDDRARRRVARTISATASSYESSPRRWARSWR